MRKNFFIIFLLFGGFSGLYADTAPKFVNPDLEGKFHFSRDYYGNGWVLIDFFATWCEPCKKELPELEALDNAGNSELTILVFAEDTEGRNVLVPYFQENPSQLTVLIDQYGKAKDAFGVSSLPSVFLINSEGEIVWQTTGYDEAEGIQPLLDVLNENGLQF